MSAQAKTESNVHFILRLALTLLIITSVVAAALAGVNALTADKIAATKAANTQAAVNAVLPGGGEEISFRDETGMVSKVYASDTGYAVEVLTAGFGGTLDMMVGVDKAGNVLAIQIISHSETPGLGAVSAAKSSAGESFRNQFAGMSGQLSVTKDGGQVEALTGATITSRAVTRGVNAALDCVAALG